MRVEVRGADGVHKMLDPYTDPKLRKRLTKAVAEGGKALRQPLRGEARKVSKRMARAVTSNATGRGIVDAPKGGDRDPKAVIGFRQKLAFFARFVVGGTRDHGPRSARALAFKGRDGHLVMVQRVRGVKPNPMVTRVAEANASAVYAAIDRSLDQTE